MKMGTNYSIFTTSSHCKYPKSEPSVIPLDKIDSSSLFPYPDLEWLGFSFFFFGGGGGGM